MNNNISINKLVKPLVEELLDLARDELNQAIKLSNNPNYEVADDPASVIA